MIRSFTILPIFALLLVVEAGCATPELNPTPPLNETAALSDAIELTHGFARAGEAYFSPDMKWIIFQASMKPDEDYQMYVAELKWEDGVPVLSKQQDLSHLAKQKPSLSRGITGTQTPIRISPIPSWNSCGYFSPDGESLIFASTALKPKMTEEPGGYQREKGSYRWRTPPGAEIFRADNWKGAVAAVPAGGSVDLAKHPLTDNSAYDAECAYSPDGKWIVFAERVDEAKPPAPPANPDSLLKDAGQGKPAAADPSHSPNTELFAMRSDGSKKVRLTNAPGYDGGPFFSPEGKRVAYRSDRKGNNLLQVYVADLVFDAAGDITGLANEKQLTTETSPAGAPAAENKDSATGPATAPATTNRAPSAGDRPAAPRGPQPAINWTPYWHPDGKHIIWASSAQGHSNYELYLMRDDGSHKTRITFTNGFDGLPVFSPDGKWLMWTSNRGPEKTSQIWIARFKLPEGS